MYFSLGRDVREREMIKKNYLEQELRIHTVRYSVVDRFRRRNQLILRDDLIYKVSAALAPPMNYDEKLEKNFISLD